MLDAAVFGVFGGFLGENRAMTGEFYIGYEKHVNAQTFWEGLVVLVLLPGVHPARSLAGNIARAHVLDPIFVPISLIWQVL